MADPLSILRSLTTRNKFSDVQWDSETQEYIFPFNNKTIRFSGDAPTAFRNSNSGEYYNLRAICVFFAHKDKPILDYVKARRAENAETIWQSDKSKLKEYLLDSSVQENLVDLVAPSTAISADASSTPLAVSELKKRGAEDGLDGAVSAGGSSNKRARSVLEDIDMIDTNGDGNEQMKAILSREIPLSTRNSVLQSEKQVFKDIISKVESQLRRDTEQQNAAKRASEARSRAPRHDRYQTVEESKFVKERLNLDEELADIAPTDTRAGFGDSAAAAANKAREIREARARARARENRARASSSAAIGVDDFGAGPVIPTSYPIILLPKVVAARVNTANVADLLQKGKYAPPGQQKTGEVIIEHNGRKYRFMQFDKLTENDWKNVVAVFVLGKDWELAKLKRIDEDAVALFEKVGGVFVKFADEPDPQLKWHVEVVEVSKNPRTSAAPAQKKIWTLIDRFVGRKKKQFPGYVDDEF